MSTLRALDSTADGRLAWLTFDRLAAALLFVVVGATACLMPAHNDTWWLLKSGQTIVETHVIPLRDTFSHTVNGQYWPNHEWLSQALFYLLYRAGGLPLVTAVAAAFVTLAWFVVWQLTPGRFGIRLFICALPIATFATEWALRPQVFTLACMAATLWLLTRRQYWRLPPLLLVWANLHGGVTLGMIVIGAVAGIEALKQRRVLIAPVVSAAACVLATCLTPLGVTLWTYVPPTLKRLREAGVSEWQTPVLADPAMFSFWCLLVVFVVALVTVRPWRKTILEQGPAFWGAIALIPASFSAARNVPVLMEVLVPAVGGLLAARFPVRVGAAERRERPLVNAAMLATVGGFAAVAVAVAWTREIPRLQWHPVPSDVITAIESCPGEIYNRYDEGGYLIWFTPDRKVFMDSRLDPYPADLVREHLRVESTGDYDALFRRYAIGCAVVPADSVLARRLKETHWTGRAQRSNWLVLTRS